MPKTYQARPVQKLQIELNESKVDIIIPFHGQYQKVYHLLQSIWASTKSNPYHIYLVDDCSPNTTFITGFEKAPYTTIIRNNQQLGFGGSLEVGFNKSYENSKELQEKGMKTNDFLVFMHSDCYIKDPYWLTELLKTYLILKNQGVRIVSATTDNPGVGVNEKLKISKDEFKKDVILTEGFIPLYCALCERVLFHQINGFIKNYPYAGYEDEELAYRMRKFRLHQAISCKSIVQHHGGATIDTLLRKNPSLAKIIFEDNRERCLKDVKILN